MDDFGYVGTYLLWGPPGTGKTTRLAATVRKIVGMNVDVGGFKKYEHPVLLSSLTRTAATELAGRDLPVHPLAVGTLHAHAYRSLAVGKDKVATGKMVAEFNKANPNMILTVGESLDADEPDYERGVGRTKGDEWAETYHLHRTRMTNRRMWSTHVQAFALAWETWKRDAGVIDFTDMIERAIEQVDHAPGKPRVVIADEAQDMSALEYTLLRKWGKAAGAMVVAGDPYQALYTWRGAHPELFNDPDVPESHRDVLRQSYRIPKAVHGAAMKWIQRLSTYRPLDYRPTESEGEIRTCGANYRYGREVAYNAMKDVEKDRTVMILASCSYMLFSTMAHLKDEGIPFANPWRTRRGDWNPLGGRGKTAAQRLLQFLKMDMPSFYDAHGDAAESGWWTHQELYDWVEVCKVDGLLEHGAKADLAACCDDPMTKDVQVNVEQILGWFGEVGSELIMDVMRDRDSTRPVGEVVDWFRKRLLASKAKAFDFPMKIVKRHGAGRILEKPKLYIGTIHSFKGAEADVVYIIPDLSQSGMEEWSRGGESRDSIIRAFYVAMTRAKESIVFVQPGGASAPIGGR